MTGSSNDSPEIKDVMKKFKIYASKIEYEDEENVKYLYIWFINTI